MTSPKVRTQPWQAAAMVGVSVLMALLCVEGFFRIIYHPAESKQGHYEVLLHRSSDNLKLLYQLIPNAEKRAYNVDNKINSHGFRDDEYSLSKPEGVLRIAFLGDSVVYGYGLAGHETIPNQLERVYADRGVPAEVLNMGVSGYDTEQAVEFFKVVGQAFRPDVVILGYCLNDSIYASMELDFFNDKAHWKLESNDFPWDKKLLRLLYKFSRFFQYLDREKKLFDWKPKLQMYMRGEKTIWHYIRDRNVRNQDPLDSDYQRLKIPITDLAQRTGAPAQTLVKSLGFLGIGNQEIYTSHWNISKKAVQELKDLGDREGFRVVLAIFPYLFDLDAYVLAPAHDFIVREMRAMGVEAVDLWPPIQQAFQLHGRAVALDPIHFSPLGTSVIAEQLFVSLQTSEADRPGTA
ncbi:MAG: GDSL-type esterase/lipase family protein [Candidatus Omnitrophota bacterium]